MAQVRQPWADVELKPAVPTAEQLEWLEAEGFIRDEEEEAEGAEGEEGGDGKAKRRVRAALRMHACACSGLGLYAHRMRWSLMRSARPFSLG